MRATETTNGTHSIFDAVMDRLETDRDSDKAVLSEESSAELCALLQAIRSEPERDQAAVTLSMLATWLVRNGELRAAAKLRGAARSGLGARFDRLDAEVRDTQARETGARFSRFADPRDTRSARSVRPATPATGKTWAAGVGVQFRLAAELAR